MLLTRKSLLTQKEHTLEIPMTEEEFRIAEAKWKQGMYIQRAFPNLNADLREFVKTGITPSEWDEAFYDYDGDGCSSDGPY